MKSISLLSSIVTTLLITTSGHVAGQAVVRTSATTLPASRPAPAAAAPAATAAATAATPTYVEEMPLFHGSGLDSVQAYLQRSIRYPDDAFIANASGRVYVGFVVNPQGKVEQVKLVKGVYPSLDREALRVVSAMPAWNSPGHQHGQPVSVAYTVPVAFQVELAMRPKAAFAATTPRPAATAGPSFPGGPDSLRAYLARGARRAAPSAQGIVFVEFDVDNNGRPRNIKALLPANDKEGATPTAYAAAVQLVEQFPAWLPGPANPQLRHQMLSFAFGNNALSSSVVYADLRYPTFPGTQPTLESLTRYIQKQAQYPEAAIDRRLQGRVYVCFEVSESGEVEHVRIIGSVAPLLDNEVLRVIRSLPRATTPPVNAGQAVRASFTLPVAFLLR